ncbi:MAG: pyridoxamine 5'-phosphate oxidase family protein [Gaiellaceae bacterium]
MRASAPRFAAPGGSLLEWADVLDVLASVRNAWLATTNPDGRPHVAPLWLVVSDGAIWFWTPLTSRKGRNLGRDGRIAIHADVDDRVAIVEGRAAPQPVPKSVVDGYALKYGSTDLDPTAFWRVEVESALAWRGHLGTEQLDATRFSPAKSTI